MRSRGQIVLGVLALVGALAMPSRIDAATVALQSFSGGVNATSGSDQLYGWVFDVLTSVDVTALGVGDFDSDGLAISHDVGIFRQSDQSLLASLTIPGGTSATLLNGFRYLSLGSSVLLSPDRYVIAMTMPSGNGDLQSIANSSVGTAAEIAYLTSAFDGGSSLAFPNSSFNGAFAEGMFGPNFQFDSAAVPEPASLLLFGSGVVTVLVRRRRGTRQV